MSDEGLAAAAACGDREGILRALCGVLAASVELCGPLQLPQLAGLSKELRACVAELAALPTGRVSMSDELASRRKTRRAGLELA